MVETIDEPHAGRRRRQEEGEAAASARDAACKVLAHRAVRVLPLLGVASRMEGGGVLRLLLVRIMAVEGGGTTILKQRVRGG